MAAESKPDDYSSLRADLETAREGGLNPALRDRIYARLTITRAFQLIEAASKPRIPVELIRLLARLRVLAREWVPPLFPADERYLNSFEGLDLATSVSELRSKRGYIHYHTRDGILARLRGSMFQAMLLHLGSQDLNHWDETQTTISFLRDVVPRKLETWSEKILGVLRFSRYEEWEDSRQKAAADEILVDILSWFLDDAEVMLRAPGSEESWMSSLHQGEPASLASRNPPPALLQSQSPARPVPTPRAGRTSPAAYRFILVPILSLRSPRACFLAHARTERIRARGCVRGLC